MRGNWSEVAPVSRKHPLRNQKRNEHVVVVVKYRHRENGRLHGKSSNFNDNSNGKVHPAEIFRKTAMPSEVVPFLSVLPKIPNFLYRCVDFWC